MFLLIWWLSVMPRNRAALAIWLLVPLSLACSAQTPATKSLQSSYDSSGERGYRTELIRGQVVWLADALKEEFDISTVPEAAKNSLAILTPDGRIHPIVENLRGRAFRKDDRLRGKEMEIRVRQYDRHPFVQVLRIYELSGDQRYEVDYWCDICAIVMFETGPCSCCQADNRLRKRPVPPIQTATDHD